MGKKKIATTDDLMASIQTGKALPQTPGISAEDAKKMVQAESQQRQQAFVNGYRALVQQTGFGLEPYVVITKDGIKADVRTFQMR